MTVKIAVIDYGMGNLLSVERALTHCGAEVIITSDADVIISATHLVLPGVGAFAKGMEELTKRNLVEPIYEFVKTGKPLLGICLGMQMLMEFSEEFGEHEGLGLIPGEVACIPDTTLAGERHKIPHIGWNHLDRASESTHPIFAALPPGAASACYVYFVHSFMAQPKQAEHVLATADYNGREIVAMIGSGNVLGCQFHPEKSGEIGLKLLKSFCSLN